MHLTSRFSALGDPVRFAIVERLLREGALSAGALHTGMGVSAPAISRHLKVLRTAGIVTRRVNRQQRIYRIEPDALREISDWSQKHLAFWSQSLDRLEQAMKREAKDGRGKT